jgi:hypothetical protein
MTDAEWISFAALAIWAALEARAWVRRWRGGPKQ